MSHDGGGAGLGRAPRDVDVVCRPTAEGFACEVVIGRDAAATRHSVTISHAELAALAPGHYDPDRLVATSFAFLLAREPREAILPRFAVSVIERYFPGYGAEMRARMGSDPDEDVHPS